MEKKITKVEVPVKYHGDEKWLILNILGDAGKLRAIKMSKPEQVPDWDSHHINEVRVNKSIRYYPKKWTIN